MPDKPLLLDKKLDELRKAESDELHINLDRIDGENVVRVAEAILTAPHLRKLHFSGGPLNEAAIGLFVQVTSQRSDIESFGWTSNRGQDEGIAQVINALGNSSKVNSIHVTWSEAGDKTMDAVIRRIEANPDFEHLFASGGTWSQATHDRLAEAVKNRPALITLNSSVHRYNPDYTAIGDALVNHPHPNLLTPTGCHLQDVKQLQEKNNAACERAKLEFSSISDSLDQQGFNAAVSAELLADTFARLPALRSYSAMSESNLQKFDELAKNLPILTRNDDISSLFASNSTGFSPIENPRTWQQHPDLMHQLQESGALNNAALHVRTEKGNSLMDIALLHCNAKDVLPIFNKYGLKLQRNALLQENGEPTKLLERLHTRGDLPVLFTEANWVGAHAQELRETVNAMPQEMQSKIPPLNSLQLALRSAQQVSTGIGR